MNPIMWQQRWEKNQTGFHEGEVNAQLAQYIDRLKLASGMSVFVPLCGKAIDMRWLIDQGYYVTANEVSDIAVRAFFKEQQMTYAKTGQPLFNCYQNEQIHIYCGDFFELTPHLVDDVQAIYDRAALVAMTAEQRPAYAQKLLSLFPHRPNMLLVTLEYDETIMQGPPFSVSPEEVERLYGAAYEVVCLQVEERIEEEVRFKEKGLSSLKEAVFLLTSRQT